MHYSRRLALCVSSEEDTRPSFAGHAEGNFHRFDSLIDKIILNHVLLPRFLGGHTLSSDILLQRVKKVRISDTVVNQILSLIEDGTVQVGDQLPGERELVDQLQVGRASVREALRILEAQGVVEVRPGKGTFVTGDVGAVDESVMHWFQQHADEVLHLLEVREALDKQAAKLAARRVKPAQAKALLNLVDQQEQCLELNDTERFVELDQAFHAMLASLSGNDLLVQLLAGVHEAMVDPRRSLTRLSGRARASVREHRAMADAIANQDEAAAESAVGAHIQSVRKAIAALREET